MEREEETETHLFYLCGISQHSKGRAITSFTLKTEMLLKVKKDREKMPVIWDAKRTDIYLDYAEQTRTYGYFDCKSPRAFR